MSPPSLLALLLTIFLALCSVLAFVLIYLRSPWHRANSYTNTSGRAKGSQGLVYGTHGLHASTALQHHDHLHSTTLAHALGTTSTNAHTTNTQAMTPSGSSSNNGAPSHAITQAEVRGGGRKMKNKRGGGGGGRVPMTNTNSNAVTSVNNSASAVRTRTLSNAASSNSSSSSSSSSPPSVYPLSFITSSTPSVIVCVTTIPSRVHHIDKCLQSIKAQNYPIKQMILAIPEESRREAIKYSIPDRVRKDAVMTVMRCANDYGPATALITAWNTATALNATAASSSSLSSSSSDSKEKDASTASNDTLLITLDDDQIYHPDTVSTLVHHALMHPDSAVGFAGYTLQGAPYIQTNLKYTTMRHNRTDLKWREKKAFVEQMVRYANAHAMQSNDSHLTQYQMDSSLLPTYDPLPDSALDDLHHSSTSTSSSSSSSSSSSQHQPNPNDLYAMQDVDVLNAWRGGICVRSSFLTDDMWKEYVTMQTEAPYWAMDEWVSSHLAKNGIKRRVILAPFDPVSLRLRLRHGRSSFSASHLAHQQTILEHAIATGRLIDRTKSKKGNKESKLPPLLKDDEQKGHMMDDSKTATLMTTKVIMTKDPALLPTSAELIRLHQLMRPYEPSESQVALETKANSSSTIIK